MRHLVLYMRLIFQKEASRHVIVRVEYLGLGAHGESGSSIFRELDAIEPASHIPVIFKEDKKIGNSRMTDRLDILFRHI